MNYDLSHLTQDPSQEVLGPIQDDEALLLYAVCKVICARHVLEFGGLNGYSARNFLQAVGPEGTVYTVERNPMERLADNHIVISKSAKDLGPHDIWHPCDLVFFDCHAYEEEGAALELLWRIGTVRVDTILAMHDTGEHPYQVVPHARKGKHGWIHVEDERTLVTVLRGSRFEAVSFHAPQPKPPIKFRHGLTFCQAGERFE